MYNPMQLTLVFFLGFVGVSWAGHFGTGTACSSDSDCSSGSCLDIVSYDVKFTMCSPCPASIYTSCDDGYTRESASGEACGLMSIGCKLRCIRPAQQGTCAAPTLSPTKAPTTPSPTLSQPCELGSYKLPGQSDCQTIPAGYQCGPNGTDVEGCTQEPQLCGGGSYYDDVDGPIINGTRLSNRCRPIPANFKCSRQAVAGMVGYGCTGIAATAIAATAELTLHKNTIIAFNGKL